jgi:Ala-tRNA(Pro) deacylase
MSIAPTLQKYLNDQHVEYDMLPHERTLSSLRTAEASHISGDCIAKGVVLRDGGGYMLAVLPASHHIRLADLQQQFGDGVEIAKEPEVEELFSDCERGAIPPIGSCYGLGMIVDESIERQPDVYLEAGDHATLIHMRQDQFAKLTGEARHGRFSVHDADVQTH